MGRQDYINIKEASVRYEVSRAKLHRLIQRGRLQTTKDPRDERLTLLRADELKALFSFPAEKEENEVSYTTANNKERREEGTLTAELCARMDGFRKRVFGDEVLADDSVTIIREAREKRTAQIEAALSGRYDDEEGQG